MCAETAQSRVNATLGDKPHSKCRTGMSNQLAPLWEVSVGETSGMVAEPRKFQRHLCSEGRGMALSTRRIAFYVVAMAIVLVVKGEASGSQSIWREDLSSVFSFARVSELRNVLEKGALKARAGTATILDSTGDVHEQKTNLGRRQAATLRESRWPAWVTSVYEDDEIPEQDVEIGHAENKFQYNPHKNRHTRSFTRQQDRSSFELGITGSPTNEQMRALQYCKTLMQQAWTSSQTVRVLVNFREFSNPDVLGSAAPTKNYIINNEFLFPMAAAKAILNRDLNKDLSGEFYYDIKVEINQAIVWYTGTDGFPPQSTFDFVTVCLHEIYHGLLISGSNLQVTFDTETRQYKARYFRPQYQSIFEAHMGNHNNCAIRYYMGVNNSYSTDLGDAVTSNNVYFVTADGTRVARLHAPRPWVDGSSLYHLSESEYGSGTDDNDLMTPIISAAYSQHNVGEILSLIQESLLSTTLSAAGAPFCGNTTGSPVIDDNPETQGGGSGSGGDRTNGGGGFEFKFGDTTVNGYVLIGGVVGGLIGIIAAAFLARMFFQGRSKAKRPPRRAEVPANYKDGGNDGGLV